MIAQNPVDSATYGDQFSQFTLVVLAIVVAIVIAGWWQARYGD